MLKTLKPYLQTNQTEHKFNLQANFIITEQLQDIEKTSNEILKAQETFLDQKIKDINTIRTQSRPKLNPKTAIYRPSSPFILHLEPQISYDSIQLSGVKFL